MQALTASLLSFLFMIVAGPGWLGVYLAESKQAVVTEVIPGTPAEKAGLEGGDVLLAVGDTKTPTREDFVRAIQGHKSGERVKIKLRRDKRERVVVVRLGERPENPGAGTDVVTEVRKPAKPAKPVPSARSAPAVEMGFDDSGAAQGKPAGKGYMGISVREADSGLAIDRVLKDGPSAESGLENGDVLRSINGKRVRSLDDLDGALSGIRAGQRVAVAIVRGDAKKTIKVTVGSRGGERRLAIPKPVRGVEIVESPVAPGPVGSRAVRVREVAAPVEAVQDPARPRRAVRAGQARRAQPARPVQPRPARRAQPVQPRSARRAQPARPSQPSRTGRQTRSNRGGDAPDYNLQRELRELRAELKELRRLLEQMRRERRGGRGNGGNR